MGRVLALSSNKIADIAIDCSFCFFHSLTLVNVRCREYSFTEFERSVKRPLCVHMYFLRQIDEQFSYRPSLFPCCNSR